MDSTEDLIETQENEEEEKNEKLLKLPLARIKHIVKMDPDVQNVSQEAVFLIGKATVYLHIYYTYFYLFIKDMIRAEKPI